ncbi:MAG: response regulator [Candidatus Omnitrophota bacterium]|nr:response regulator [Candidatus Omnitrophota bacterium]MDZ4242209.1 response regulator [Candidatus Omnitrophota bacterium]
MKGKILIIDDEKEMAQFMSWRLARADFDSRLAFDGQDGLTMLEEEEPDLILTDIVMPKMDGYTLCKTLQERGTLSKIPVVVMTAYANRAEDFEGMGIQAFLVKPFDGQKLVDVIEQILDKKSRAECHKKVLLQDGLEAGVPLALKQFRELGYDAQVDVMKEEDNFIEEILRHHPDVLILDASRPGVPAHQIIHSLRSYVLLQDMTILFYLKNKGEEPKGWFRKGKNKLLEETKAACLKAGAVKYLDSMDREAFLSVLFEYCR